MSIISKVNEIDKQRIQTLFPRASKSFIEINSELQNSKLERDKAAALDIATKRKKESVLRVKVSFIGYRCRPLDPDNFAGGCKDLLDGLRHAGLIPDDRPEDIIFETTQQKVYHRGEERTQIMLEY